MKKTPSQLIDIRIKELGDWRGKALGKVRKLIKAAAPDVVEAWKWAIPVWEYNGIICTGETYKEWVKMTFPKGSKLKDPKKLFHKGQKGARRALHIREGDKIDEAAFKVLVKQAAELNGKDKPKRPTKETYHDHANWHTTEAALFEGINEDLKDAFLKLKEFALALGEQRSYAAGKSIMFSRKACYFFARPKKSYVELVIFLGHGKKSPGFHSAKAVAEKKYAHTFKLVHADQVEGELTDSIEAAFKRYD